MISPKSALYHFFSHGTEGRLAEEFREMLQDGKSDFEARKLLIDRLDDIHARMIPPLPPGQVSMAARQDHQGKSPVPGQPAHRRDAAEYRAGQSHDGATVAQSQVGRAQGCDRRIRGQSNQMAGRKAGYKESAAKALHESVLGNISISPPTQCTRLRPLSGCCSRENQYLEAPRARKKEAKTKIVIAFPARCYRTS